MCFNVKMLAHVIPRSVNMPSMIIIIDNCCQVSNFVKILKKMSFVEFFSLCTVMAKSRWFLAFHKQAQLHCNGKITNSKVISMAQRTVTSELSYPVVFLNSYYESSYKQKSTIIYDYFKRFRIKYCVQTSWAINVVASSCFQTSSEQQVETAVVLSL